MSVELMCSVKKLYTLVIGMSRTMVRGESPWLHVAQILHLYSSMHATTLVALTKGIQ